MLTGKYINVWPKSSIATCLMFVGHMCNLYVIIKDVFEHTWYLEIKVECYSLFTWGNTIMHKQDKLHKTPISVSGCAHLIKQNLSLLD